MAQTRPASKPSTEDIEELLQCARYGDEGDLESIQAAVEQFGAGWLAEAKDDRGNTMLHLSGANGHDGESDNLPQSCHLFCGVSTSSARSSQRACDEALCRCGLLLDELDDTDVRHESHYPAQLGYSDFSSSGSSRCRLPSSPTFCCLSPGRSSRFSYRQHGARMFRSTRLHLARRQILTSQEPSRHSNGLGADSFSRLSHTAIVSYLLPLLPPSALVATNEAGSTPLHWISLNYHLATLKQLCPLLPRDAFDLRNAKGKTAVQEAEEACEAFVVPESEQEKKDSPRAKERVRREVVVGYLLQCMGLGVKKPNARGEAEPEEADGDGDGDEVAVAAAAGEGSQDKETMNRLAKEAERLKLEGKAP